jgi:hypothetical protein
LKDYIARSLHARIVDPNIYMQNADKGLVMTVGRDDPKSTGIQKVSIHL